MDKLQRYSLIKDKFSREFVLLKGTGCKWRKCTFCDYYLDVDNDPFKTNREVLKHVSGKFGVLDIINSGSMLELDEETIGMIQDVVKKCKIHTLWFEAHWMYRDKLQDFSDKFTGVCVKYRIGVETFNKSFRDTLNKGIPNNIEPMDISEYFRGVCLLVGIDGQTREMVLNDIEIASKYFEYFSVNVFNKNTTGTVPSPEIVDWFKKEVYPKLFKNIKAEVLISNKDLGVG